MIAAIALVTLTAVTLTGCLVTQKEQGPLYERKTDNLRIYKQGDWIRYNVFATTANGDFSSGTLEIRWGNYSPLTSPDTNANNNGNPYDVIEKRYLFCLNDTDGTPCTPQVVAIQYVHQDDSTTDTSSDPATDGTEWLVAVGNHPTAGQYYWLNTTGGSTATPDNPDNPYNNPDDSVVGGQEPVITLKSPLSIGQSYSVEYDLMDDCVSGNASCGSDIGHFSNTIEVVGDGTPINTNIDNYANPFRVNFAGDVFPDADVDGQLPVTLDIFDLCSNGISNHSGYMYIVPEIGVIQLRNTCADLSGTGDSIRYDITIDSISPSIRSGS